MSETGKLEREIIRWEQKLAEVQKGQQAAQRRQEAIESERKRYVVAALAEGDAAAQKEIRRLDGELDRASRDLKDYSAVIAEVEQTLSVRREELAIARRQAERDRIRALVQQRLTKAKRIADAVEQLKQAVREAVAPDAEIDAALLQLYGSRLAHMAKLASQSPRAYVWAFIKNYLSGVLPVDSTTHHSGKELESLEALDREFFGRLLEAIEHAPLDGDAESGGRLYQATHAITGLKGNALRPGDQIRLRPEEAEELI
ncbi:MAG: hypothetical protein L0177_09005, partial [Chloroflexi bacterium]|nr:hypothetical protein [Chloroflexota bacterium]